jgi:hypothetical protein
MMVKAKQLPSEAIGNGGAPNEPVGVEVARHRGLVQVRIVFQGLTPLLMNAMGVDQLLAIRDKEKAPKTAARPSLREEAESKLHRLPDGRPHVPAKCLYACLINAGQFVRLDGKRQITTEKKTILPGMLTLASRQVPLTLHDGLSPAPWEVDIQQGRNPNGGEAVCIVRPRLDEWQFECAVEVDQRQMPLPMARQLVEIAGRRIGLLEYSPRHKGTYGTFVVVNWEVVPPVA